MAAGVQLTDLRPFANQALKKQKKLRKQDKNLAVNPFADAGTLSRDKYTSRDPKSGSYQWAQKLKDENPIDDDFHLSARSFIRPDEKGFREADDAYQKWENFAFVPFQPGNKVGALADRIDTPDVQAFYDTYTNSRLIGPETYVGSSNLAYMFEMPANEGSTENNPNEANISPSKGIAVG